MKLLTNAGEGTSYISIYSCYIGNRILEHRGKLSLFDLRTESAYLKQDGDQLRKEDRKEKKMKEKKKLLEY